MSSEKTAPRGHTPDVRDEDIIASLLTGATVTATARSLGCARATVRAVRDRSDVQQRLAEERAKRIAAHDGAIEDARRILREAAPLAAYVLMDALQHPDPKVRARASAQLLDRIGIPRIEEVLTRALGAPDLSKLTDDELREWERLNAKVTPT